MIQIKDLLYALPLLIISAGSIIVLLIEIIFGKSTKFVYIFSIIFTLGAIVSCFLYLDREIYIFNEFLRFNNVSLTFSVLLLVSALLTLISSESYLKKHEINFSEYYCIILFAVTGMLIMVASNDLIALFIGLELMSICFYTLAGFMRKRLKSNESALKYFLLGAFMTGFLLYGIALMYGAAGTTNIIRILSNPAVIKTPVFLIGITLFMIGLFFKIGFFPFHMWIPDVYDGAPTIVSGFMSTAGKISAVGTLVPIVIYFNIIDFKILFSVIAVLTMLYGNIIAVVQSNLKRLLAYSSIASAGYIMVGLSAMNDFSIKGISFYLIAYVFMQLGAFIIVSVIEEKSAIGNDFTNISIENYKGLAQKNPFLSILLTVFLLSLAGIPPLAGFWGKYYLFYAAVKSNLIWLSIVAIILSVVSVYYYLKVIVYMWFQESENGYKIAIAGPVYIAILISFIGTLIFGIYPEMFFYIFRFIIN